MDLSFVSHHLKSSLVPQVLEVGFTVFCWSCCTPHKQLSTYGNNGDNLPRNCPKHTLLQSLYTHFPLAQLIFKAFCAERKPRNWRDRATHPAAAPREAGEAAPCSHSNIPCSPVSAAQPQNIGNPLITGGPLRAAGSQHLGFQGSCSLAPIFPHLQEPSAPS